MTPSPRIPPAALALGLAGVLPFGWAMLTSRLPGLAETSAALIGTRLSGTALASVYGTAILSFMAGTIWAYAAKGDGPGWLYAASTLPALWAVATGGPLALAAGFVALLGLDAHVTRTGLGPPWWLRLRLLLTTLVVALLLLTQG